MTSLATKPDAAPTGKVTTGKVATDPASLGFDPERLQRIDDHFARYVDSGRLPGWQIAITRGGTLAHSSTYGRRDIEQDLPWESDTIVRMFSMSKPITSVAAMILYEEGKFQLKDQVSKYIPAFGNTPVYRSGSVAKPVVEPQNEPMRIWHLLTHMSGLTYGFHNTHPTDALHREAGFGMGLPAGLDLEACCNEWAKIPLVFQPGSEWNYGVSTDVLGRVVEVISGQPLDVFLRERILDPLNDRHRVLGRRRQTQTLRAALLPQADQAHRPIGTVQSGLADARRSARQTTDDARRRGRPLRNR